MTSLPNFHTELLAMVTRISIFLILTLTAFADHTLTLNKAEQQNFKSVEPAKFDANKNLIFEDGQHILLPEEAAKKFPSKNFTISTTVRVDQPQQWGCIIGYSQDNGSYERGWLLGFTNDRFTFKLSTGGPLISAVSNKPFIPGQTYQVTATYDGKTILLFVDGIQVAKKEAPGEVKNPDIPTPFVIGAYKDKDEFFPLTGRIESITLKNSLTSAAEITAEAKKNQFHFAVRPSISFLTDGKARVEWESTHPGPGMINFGTTPDLGTIITSDSKTTAHAITLENLEPATEYHLRIGTRSDGKLLTSPPITFDTTMNYLPVEAPDYPALVPSPEAVKYVQNIVELYSDKIAGHALILGGTDGKLAYELARKTKLKITIVDRDPARVAAIRQAIYPTGIYGTRISVIHAPTAEIPLASCSANFILSERTLAGEDLPYPASEFKRLTRPSGGKVFTKKLTYTRPALPGSGEWTHQYGSSENRSFVNEDLADADQQSDFTIQWLGRPGADFGIDRQNRIPAPIAVNGRTFLQGLSRMIALDAFNGQILWSKEIPDLRRLNIPHDSSNWCADQEHLYVAIADRAWVIDAATGTRLTDLKLTSQKRDTHDWGYIANTDDLVIGTTVPKGAQFTSYWGADKWYDKAGNAEAITQITSDKIFAYDKKSSIGLWAYGNGLIINSTITVSENKIYFLENRHPDLVAGDGGRVSDKRLWQQTNIVCLNAKTGKPLFKKPLTPVPQIEAGNGYVQAAYGQMTNNGYLIMLSVGGPGANHFLYNQLDSSGNVEWATSTPWDFNHHGAHISHPVVFEDKIYTYPYGININNGKQLKNRMPKRRSCPTPVGFKNGLLYRAYAPGVSDSLSIYSFGENKNTGWNRLRSSCWLNYLPAQGMIIMSEGGGGCACGGWMETSISLIPKKHTK